MAAKKGSAGGGGGGLSGRVVAGAIAVAVISSVSSFLAIRFALPKQIVVIQKDVVETPPPAKQAELEGDLWTIPDAFIVNTADPTHHFLKVDISLMIAKPPETTPGGAKTGGEGAPDPAKAVMARMLPVEPVYRDAIISTLRRQTMATLYEQDRVKSEIKVALNLLDEQDPQRYPKTLAVYFSDFVIQ